MVAVFEGFVTLFDVSCGFGEEALQQGEEFAGVKGFEGVVGARAGGTARGGNNNDGDVGIEGFEGVDEFFAGDVGHGGVGDYAIECRVALQRFDSFIAAVGGDDVELCSFNNEFTGGDGAGGFTVYDEEARSDHTLNYLSKWTTRFKWKKYSFNRQMGCGEDLAEPESAPIKSGRFSLGAQVGHVLPVSVRAEARTLRNAE